MKVWFFIMFFCAFLRAYSNPPTFSNWLATDKQYHFIAGYAIGGASSYVCRRLNLNKIASCGIGMATGTAVGLGKEYLWDRKFHGTVSLQDAVATSIGSAVGSISIVIIF